MSKNTEYIYTDSSNNPLYKQVRVQNGQEKEFYSEKYSNR